MQSPIEVDVAIIGAGPSGLFAVFQCGMAGLKCAVFDSLEDIGGQCAALYPEKPIYDIPGCPEILAGDLIANLERQAAPFEPDYYLGQQIVSVSRQSGYWLLQTVKGISAQAKAIIIAAGGGAFGPNRPPLEGIEAYEGTGVQYMVRRRDALKGKRIVVAGGGDSALDWALALAADAEKLYLVHRRDKFRAASGSVRKLEQFIAEGLIEPVIPYQLHSLAGRDGVLNAVGVISPDGEKRSLKADLLLPFYGLAATLGPITTWGLSLDQHHIAVDPVSCSTNIEGIYAVGDIAAYKGKLKLILTGFNEAALVAHDIRAKLYPDRTFHFEYSTTKGLPGMEKDHA